MPDSSARGNPGHPAGLLLRVSRPGGHPEEFYLADGLTIGRTEANTVVLADDEAVDRTHARVEVEDGAARLGCVGPDGLLDVGGARVRRLILHAGLRFRIGRTEFECLPGRLGDGRGVAGSAISCPFCGSTTVPLEGEGARPCPGCDRPILPVRPDPPDQGPILLPAAYGAYRADRYVARGGMGLVLKGSGEDGHGTVAIKVLMDAGDTGPGDRERFDREVEMMARVQSPHVVRLLNHGQSGRYRYLILEWIEGPSLRQKIADANHRGHRARFEKSLDWIERICKGVAAVHAVGIVHRDIKPGNILIGPDGIPRLADLGIARRIDASFTSYTMTGYASGTFDYMAPEQIDAPDTVDGRADLYALGVTFYELLTGTRPAGAWRPASKVNRSVPATFDEVLRRLMAPEPARRFGDIYVLMSALVPFRALPASTPLASISEPVMARAEETGRTPQIAEQGREREDSPIAAYLRSIGSLDSGLTTPLRPPSDGETFATSTLPITPEQTSKEDRSGERDRIIAKRSRYNKLSMLLAVPGIILMMLMSFADWQLPGVGVAFYGGAALVTLAFGFVAMYRGLHPLLGAYIFLALAFLVPWIAGAGEEIFGGFLMVGFFMVALLPDRYGSRLKQLESPMSTHGWPPGKTSRFPRYFGRSIIPCVFCPLAPVSLWFSILGYRERHDKSRIPPLSVVAMIWAGCWSLLWLGGVLALCLDRSRLDHKSGPDGIGFPISGDRASRTGTAMAHVERGIAQMKANQLDGAISELNEAIKLDPNLAAAYNARALAWLGKGEYGRTIADSGEAIRLLPSFAEPYVWRGAAYRSKWEVEPAIRDLTEAITLDPAKSLGHVHRGLAYLAKNDPDQAISDFSEAILRDPAGSAQAYSNRALAHKAKGELDRALLDCEKALELDPALVEAYLWRGSILAEKGDHDRAIQDLGEALRLDPSQGLAYNNRGLAHYNKREFELALVDYNAAIRLDANNPIFLMNRGICHQSMRSHDAAVADLEAALRIDPSRAADCRRLIDEVSAARRGGKDG